MAIGQVMPTAGETGFQRALAIAYREHNSAAGKAWNAPIDAPARAAIRTAVAREKFSEAYGRAPADDRIVRVFSLSCATGAGVEQFRRALFELCAPAPEPEPADDGLVDFLVYRPRPNGHRFRVLRTDRGFRVVGDAPSDAAELEAALRNAGIRTGDEVEIAGEVSEWE